MEEQSFSRIQIQTICIHHTGFMCKLFQTAIFVSVQQVHAADRRGGTSSVDELLSGKVAFLCPGTVWPFYPIIIVPGHLYVFTQVKTEIFCH